MSYQIAWRFLLCLDWYQMFWLEWSKQAFGYSQNVVLTHTLFFFQPTEVSKALQAHRVSERIVCVNLHKLGRWFYGFRLPDEYESRKISLGELTMAEGAEILAILNRGAVHEVFRLRISLVNVDKWSKVQKCTHHKYLACLAHCKYVYHLMPSGLFFVVNATVGMDRSMDPFKLLLHHSLL